jgi:hypothetical protein
MSTIKSSTTTTTAYSVEADTTGALVIQTGATPTTAVTVSSAQVVTLANALPVASGGTNATTASAARTSLGLVIGTDVLAPSGSGASLTSLNATNISSGTVAKARLPAGSVLQVVQTTSSTAITNSSSTFATTGLTQAITPSSASSKILIMTYCPIRFGSSNGLQTGIRINKNSGTILMTDTLMNNVSAIVDISYPVSLNYLDSPATTSSTTYTIEFNTTGAASVYTYPTVNYTGVPHLCTLTLMEIAG